MTTVVERCAGCVVYRYAADSSPLILLIYDKYGCWTLPKGHLDPGEHEEDAAAREVREETGISGELGALIGRIDYQVVKRGEQHDKQVAFFLMHAANHAIVPQADEGISAAGWFPPDEALARSGYPQVSDVLTRAIEKIAAN